MKMPRMSLSLSATMPASQLTCVFRPKPGSCGPGPRGHRDGRRSPDVEQRHEARADADETGCRIGQRVVDEIRTEHQRGHAEREVRGVVEHGRDVRRDHPSPPDGDCGQHPLIAVEREDPHRGQEHDAHVRAVEHAELLREERSRDDGEDRAQRADDRHGDQAQSDALRDAPPVAGHVVQSDEARHRLGDSEVSDPRIARDGPVTAQSPNSSRLRRANMIGASRKRRGWR